MAVAAGPQQHARHRGLRAWWDITAGEVISTHDTCLAASGRACRTTNHRQNAPAVNVGTATKPEATTTM